MLIDKMTRADFGGGSGPKHTSLGQPPATPTGCRKRIRRVVKPPSTGRTDLCQSDVAHIPMCPLNSWGRIQREHRSDQIARYRTRWCAARRRAQAGVPQPTHPLNAGRTRPPSRSRSRGCFTQRVFETGYARRGGHRASSSWRFEAFPYRTAPKGPPSSLVQHGALAPS